eukprot:TRINITY_DN14805_c0_g1_i1.p1 TRINITY_DN14805_c0_g1~~TRINITY_DN14805_c0_g1_i1.p1  ORF type:complete len:522 (-),score=117.44 TRINITY_DN14805_c0_g1_i1:33-1418(-)
MASLSVYDSKQRILVESIALPETSLALKAISAFFVVGNCVYLCQDGGHVDMISLSYGNLLNSWELCSVFQSDESKMENSGSFLVLVLNSFSVVYSPSLVGNNVAVCRNSSLSLQVTRRLLARQIVDTERKYCDQLRTLIEFLRRAAQIEQIPREAVMELLRRPEILLDLHLKFLQGLEENVDDLASTFFKFLGYFKMYSDYFASFDRRKNALATCLANKKFLELQEKLFNKIKATFEQLLEVPMLRIQYYPKILEEYLQSTSPDHPDNYGLEQVLRALQNIVKVIVKAPEERKAMEEAIEIISQVQLTLPQLQLSAEVKFICKGAVVLLDSSSKKNLMKDLVQGLGIVENRILALFNRYLVVYVEKSYKKAQMWQIENFVSPGAFPLENDESKQDKPVFGIRVMLGSGPAEEVRFQTQTILERDQWIDKINKTLEQEREIVISLQTRQAPRSTRVKTRRGE